jgi:hypothetical protein
LGGKSRASEVLSQPIVQIVTQPPPLMICHSCDLLIELPPLSHLAFQRCRPFFNPSIEFPNKRS